MMFRRKPTPAGSDDPLLTADLPARVEAARSRLAHQDDPALQTALSVRHPVSLRRWRRWTVRAMVGSAALGGIVVALTVLADQPPHAAVADLLIGPATGLSTFGFLSVTMMAFDALIDWTPARNLTSLYAIAAAALAMMAAVIWCSDSLAHADQFKVFFDVVVVGVNIIAVLVSWTLSHAYAQGMRPVLPAVDIDPSA